MATRPAYPRHWEADIVARDGATMHVRPVLPADAPGLQALHVAQSEQSRFFRFFGYRGDLTQEELERFTHVDHRDRVALVVTDREGGPLLAFGCYDAVDARTAEVAFYVADSQQGRGLGSVLLDHLAAAGRERGLTRFVADVLPTNAKMLAVFRAAGYTVDSGFEDGVVGVSVDISTTDKSWRVMTAREQYAESRSMRVLMNPGTVVPVGSGRAAHLLDLLPPECARGGQPGEGRLAVVAVDDRDLVGALERLGADGVSAAVVLSGRGTHDPGWHAAVLDAARGNGVRLVGPGSYGVLTAGGANLTLVPGMVGGGTIGVFAQSARSSAGLASRLVARGLPVSGFISAGHRTDVSGNDAMQWWSTDESTRVVALSLDSIGNPRKFARIARHLASSRTVMCHIDSATGQSAPPGHLVRTSPLPRAVLSGMLRQAGVIEAADHEELIDLAHVAVRRPVGGRRVHIAATTPSAAEFVARAAREHGLEPTRDEGDIRLAVDLPLAGEERSEPNRGEATLAIAAEPDRSAGIAVVDDVGSALRIVSKLAAVRARDSSRLVAADDVSPASVAEILAGAEEGVLDGGTAARLLAAYGIEVVPSVEVDSESEGLAVAMHLGYPLAVKARDEVLRHRVDLGGVHLDVHDDSDLVHAIVQLRALGVSGACLQRMVPPGPACVLTAVEDPLYGPVVSFGLAGDAVEFLSDVSYRITPLSYRDVAELVDEPRAAVRLRGHRGRAGYDPDQLREVVGRLALLKDDFPAIARIELNPVVVSHAGAFPLSVEVEVRAGVRADGSRRTLPSLGLE
ncbi:MAG: GNAT family N-acetyltransferase [Actinomycetota bacterium]